MTVKKKALTGIIGIFLVFGCWLLNSCTKANEESLRETPNGQPQTPSCDTVGMKYQTDVVPILTNNCYKCHSASTYRANSGINLEDFNTLKSEATSGTLLNAIKQNGSASPMPIGASKLSDCDINKIDDWIKNGTLNN